MESRVNYTLVGLTVLVLTIGLIAAGIWLSMGFDRKQYNHYLVYMSESVSGLSEESAVKFNGVKVGKVCAIEFSKINPQQTKILIKVEQGTPITESTYATLITQGITGTTFLGLSPSSTSFKPIQKTPGQPYPVIPSKPSFMNQLEKNINEVSKGIKEIFNEQNAKNLKIALKEMPKVLKAFQASTRKFNALADDMSIAGKQVTSTMKVGKDSIEKISNQTLPPAIMLLRKLDHIASNLEEVSAQMRQNPSVIIRGTTGPQPGPGE